MNTLYGSQTKQALANFPFPLPKTDLDLIYSIVKIKKAAALANASVGILEDKTAIEIAHACDEILKGKYDNQFVTPSLQGGAGTSINMNVNEVIAALSKTHPNDDINMSQSTNDVKPAALKITCITLLGKLLKKLKGIISEFERRAKLHRHVLKLGRTHLQDAVPTTVGEEMESYAKVLESDKYRLEQVIPY